jgi:hypothetical protein
VTDDLVAVGKPPSLPVHASGPFRKNSVAGVLQAEAAALGPLRPVHRLDNSVSGVLLLARSAAAAHALNARIQARGAPARRRCGCHRRLRPPAGMRGLSAGMDAACVCWIEALAGCTAVPRCGRAALSRRAARRRRASDAGRDRGSTARPPVLHSRGPCAGI